MHRDLWNAKFDRSWVDRDRRPYSSKPRNRPSRARKTSSFGFGKKAWDSSLAADGTLVEVYLRQRRGLRMSEIPDTIRFCPSLYHRETDIFFPAMIVSIRKPNTGEILGFQATWLSPDGRDKAGFRTSRKTFGKITGGVVLLGKPHPTLLVGEGVETVLAAMELAEPHNWGLAPVNGWATIGSSNFVNALQSARADDAKRIILLGDGDEAGRKAVKRCRELANRLRFCGIQVDVLMAVDGEDFNDELLNSLQSRGA